MKTIIISILLVVATMVCSAQAQLGMSSVYSFSPSSTVTHGTSVYLKVYIKNKSNVTFTGDLSVKAQVDTIGGVSCGDSLQGNAISILANDSISATLIFTPQPGQGAFNQINCCVNPIIVWPYVSVGSGVVIDSLRCGLHIVSNVGVKELVQQEYKVYPSPAKDFISIKQLTGIKPKTVIIYDMYGQKVREFNYSETINIADLSPGCYWLIINSSENKTHEQLLLKE